MEPQSSQAVYLQILFAAGQIKTQNMSIFFSRKPPESCYDPAKDVPAHLR